MEKLYNIDFSKINDKKTLKNIQNEINEGIANHLSTLEFNEWVNHHSKSSFGHIKECFEAISPVLFESKSGKALLKQYVDTIKESKNLSTLHNIYESIRKAGNDIDVDYFINTLVHGEKNIDKKTLKEDVQKLGNVLAMACTVFGKGNENLIPEENTKLNNAIEYVVEHKSSTKNLPEFSLAVKTIREDIESREHSIKLTENINIDDTVDNLVDSFNEKYAGELNEEEMKVVNEILTSNNSEEVFEKYVNECVKKINEKKDYFLSVNDTTSVNRLNDISEQISKKKYNTETLTEDISNIIEITQLFG